jgi:radical SAM superfamily enzyme YgiQ (UPF0313 family)
MNTMKKRPLRVYLCDLTHDTVVLVSDTIPINIGFIASYVKKIHGDAIEVSLYKFPKSVIDAIRECPPDVIALSNYSWNSNLSERVAQIAKQANPNVVTVQGGTNFPHRHELQLDFLLQRPATDFHVELEGEVAFSNLLARVLEARDGGKGIYETPVDGCVFIQPETRHSKKPVLVRGNKPERIKCLDDIPSPYLTGILDKFFDGRLTPFLETNRGCPFTCSFCHTGNEYFNRINQFSMERIVDEIKYIAPRVAKHGIVNLHIADTNFGMYQRDKAICEALLESQKNYGWPLQCMSTTGKNNKERVIEITQIMGNTFSVNMSVQSMDPTVLENIKRSNIKLEHYMAINKSLTERGRSTKGEVIIGLPGETKASFVRGVEQIINAGVSSVCSYSLMLLHGTLFKEPEYREKFQIQGKYRIVPLNFGEYEGVRVFDIEETGIANKDMSFDDYLWIRGLSLMVEVMHNSRPFHELFHYSSAVSGLSLFDFIKRVYDSLNAAPANVQKIVHDFLEETKGELWDTEEELLEYFRKDENYERLLKGEVGGNLIYKYKAISLAFNTDEWIEFLATVTKKIVAEKIQDPAALEKVTDDLRVLTEFMRNRLAGVLNVDGDLKPREMKSPFDIVAWKAADITVPLEHFRLREPITYQFNYTKDQLMARTDQFKRYGTHANGLSKIVTRVSNVESLFRKVTVAGQVDQVKEEREVDQFIRYTLSN